MLHCWQTRLSSAPWTVSNLDKNNAVKILLPPKQDEIVSGPLR